MKILYGFYRADAGQILFEGKPVAIRSPQDAIRLHIGMVFQDFSLIPAFSVAENIALFLSDLKAIPDMQEINRLIRNLSSRYGMDITPEAWWRTFPSANNRKLKS